MKKEIFSGEFADMLENYMAVLSNLEEFSMIIEICRDVLSAIEIKFTLPSAKNKIKLTALKEIGDAQLRSFNFEKALGAFMEAYIINPSDIDIKLGLASYYESINDYETTKRLCREILERDSKNDHAYFRLGMAHVFLGEKEEARKHLIEAYKLNPDDLATKRNLLHCFYELGKLKVLTNCDELEYFDELSENGEGDKIIKNEIESADINIMRVKLEKWFKEE